LKKSSPLSKALKIYGDKGPVNRESSQRAAKNARRIFEHLLTDEEKTKLSIAWSHACFVNEGRREFDMVMKSIKERILGKT
jgi:hypothetical protein